MSNIWWCANYSSHLTTKDSGVIHREWDRSLDDTQWLTKNKSQRKHMQLQHWLSTPHTWATTMDDQCTWENRRMATTKMKNPRECSGLLSSLLEPMFIESCVVEWRVKDCNTQTHFLFSLAPRSKYHQCSVCVCEIDAWFFSVSTITLETFGRFRIGKYKPNLSRWLFSCHDWKFQVWHTHRILKIRDLQNTTEDYKLHSSWQMRATARPKAGV